MRIEEISSSKEMREILDEFADSFIPPLYETVENISLYAEKLAENSKNLVICHNDEKLGFICFYANDLKSKRAFISLICVKEKYQKNGYATVLLKKMFEFCKDSMSSVELEVYADNVKAIEFYKKNGFQKIEKQPGNPKTFFMRKAL